MLDPESKDPRPTDNLADTAAWPFWDGADEVVIRVSRYEEDMRTPACFQVVVKHQDRTKIWGVAVLANPVAAIMQAIAHFYERDGEPWPNGGEVGKKREPLIEDPDLEDLLS